ncbi:MAG: hypothetical protein ACE5I1_04585 [bacterium]
MCRDTAGNWLSDRYNSFKKLPTVDSLFDLNKRLLASKFSALLRMPRTRSMSSFTDSTG